MRTFIQLHDGIGFAVLRTEGEPDHSVTPDHITAIEVFTEDPEQFLKMKYDEKTKSWSEPPLYVWGVVDWDGSIIEIRRTYFEHEVNGPLLPEDFNGSWKWKDNAWVIPEMPKVDAYGNPIKFLSPWEEEGFVEEPLPPTVAELENGTK